MGHFFECRLIGATIDDIQRNDPWLINAQFKSQIGIKSIAWVDSSIGAVSPAVSVKALHLNWGDYFISERYACVKRMKGIPEEKFCSGQSKGCAPSACSRSIES